MVFQANLDRHVGGGSRIDGLVAHITTFRKIEVLDVRGLPNLGGQVNTFRKHLTEDSSFLLVLHS